MGDVGTLPAVLEQVEAPGRDAFVPVGQYKGKITVLVGGNVILPVPVVHAAGQAAGWRQVFLDIQQAGGAGFALRVDGAAAVAHGDVHAGHRFAAVERGDPCQRGFAPLLEMHGHVGGQRRRADVVGLLLRHQRFAQAGARHFDDMEAGFLQRNADDFRFAVGQRLGQGESLYLVLRAEDGLFGAEFLDCVPASFLVIFPIVLIELLNPFKPGNHLHRLLRDQAFACQHCMTLVHLAR